jgi:hypothetical protein
MEIKASIPEWPDYMVTNTGRVLSYKGKNRAERVMKIQNSEYPQVTLRRNGRKYTRSVHVLMALAFWGPPEPGYETRHINGNNFDNRLENLAYGTSSQNSIDQVIHGTHYMARKTHCKWGHEFTPENTVPQRNGRKGRLCVECQRRYARESNRRKRAQKLAARATAIGTG